MWTAVLLAGLASYLLRVLPLFVLSRVELPERVTEGLQHAAMGAMAVLLVTATARAAGVDGVAAVADAGAGVAVPEVGHALGVVAGVGLGLLLARRARSMLVVLLACVSVSAVLGWAAVEVGARVG